MKCPKCGGRTTHDDEYSYLGKAEALKCVMCGWRQPVTTTGCPVTVEQPLKSGLIIVTFDQEVTICNLRRYASKSLDEIAFQTGVDIEDVKEVLRINGINKKDKPAAKEEMPMARVRGTCCTCKRPDLALRKAGSTCARCDWRISKGRDPLTGNHIGEATEKVKLVKKYKLPAEHNAAAESPAIPPLQPPCRNRRRRQKGPQNRSKNRKRRTIPFAPSHSGESAMRSCLPCLKHPPTSTAAVSSTRFSSGSTAPLTAAAWSNT